MIWLLLQVLRLVCGSNKGCFHIYQSKPSRRPRLGCSTTGVSFWSLGWLFNDWKWDLKLAANCYQLVSFIVFSSLFSIDKKYSNHLINKFSFWQNLAVIVTIGQIAICQTDNGSNLDKINLNHCHCHPV